MMEKHRAQNLVALSLFSACLALLLVVMLASAVDAQAPQKECVGADIAFLIDQSRSMQRNDQHQLRRSAVATAIDIIGDNAIYHCPGVVHRIAVIGFGGTSVGVFSSKRYTDTYTSVYVTQTTTISGTIDKLGVWKNQRENQIKSSIPITDDLVATDHMLAFRVAAQVLRTWKSEQIGEYPRKKVVIMITDGGPCVNVVGDACDWTETKYGSRDNYLRQLELYTDPVGDKLPFRGENNPDSVFVWIIAFADSSIRGYDYLADATLRNTWENIASFHGGKLMILPRGKGVVDANTEVTKRVAEITDDVLSSELTTWPCDEPLWVLPYQNNITILHVFKRGADTGVRLEAVKVSIRVEQGGEPVAIFSRGRVTQGQGEVADYTHDGPNERYVLYSPPPGKYSIDVEGADLCDDIDVELGRVGIEANVISPATNDVFSEVEEEPFYDLVSPKQFAFQFLEPATSTITKPVHEVQDFPLTATVILKGTGIAGEKLTEEYKLKLTDPEQAIYESYDLETDLPAYIKTPFAGYYKWELRVETVNPRSFEPDSKKVDPVTVLDTNGIFEVKKVAHFDFEIVHPRNDDLILAYDMNEAGSIVPVPIDVEIQLVDENGSPVDPAIILANETADTFEILLENADGVLLESVKARPSFGKSTISATIRQLPASETPDPPGKYQLDVRLLGNYIRDTYRPLSDRHEVLFERSGVRLFSFAVISPPRGIPLPLIEGQDNRYLELAVQLQDQDGKPVSGAQLMKSESSAPFEASLLNADGVLLDERKFSYSRETNDFRAQLRAGEGFTETCYTVHIRLTDDYKTEVFRPQLKAIDQKICMRIVRDLYWSILSPISHTLYPLHETLGWFPPPLPVPTQIEIRHKDGDVINTDDAVMNQSDANLFSGKLQFNNGEKSYDVNFLPGEDGSFYGEWPLDAFCPGEYTLQVDLNDKSLSPAYRTLTTHSEIPTFLHQDTLLSYPWALASLLLLCVAFLFVFWVVYRAIGPLVNAELQFKLDGQPVGSVPIAGALNRRSHVVKRKQLDYNVPTLNLDKIVAQTSRQSINITLFWLKSGEVGGYEMDEVEQSSIEDFYANVEPNQEIAVEGSTSMQLIVNRYGRFDWLNLRVAGVLISTLFLWGAVDWYLANRPPC